MEKAVKELRAMVFQGRETGQPVVIQPADTDSQINALTDHLNDLDRTLNPPERPRWRWSGTISIRRARKTAICARVAVLKNELDPPSTRRSRR